jgi:hypothetical protein
MIRKRQDRRAEAQLDVGTLVMLRLPARRPRRREKTSQAAVPPDHGRTIQTIYIGRVAVRPCRSTPANQNWNALRSITDVKILSTPSVVVVDNPVATLVVGDQLPISTQSATILTNPNTPLINTVDYRNTGVILRQRQRQRAAQHRTGDQPMFELYGWHSGAANCVVIESSRRTAVGLHARNFASSIRVHTLDLPIGGHLREIPDAY